MSFLTEFHTFEDPNNMLRKEDRNKNISLMGKELGEMFSEMCSQWAGVQYKLDNYMMLFNEDGAKILNKLSGIKYIQDELSAGLIISICRLLDHKQTAGKLLRYMNAHEDIEFAKTVSSKIEGAFLYVDSGIVPVGDLRSNKDKDETLEFPKKVEKHKKILRKGSLREFRNRWIAHSDPTYLQKPQKWVDVARLTLDATHDVLDTIYKYHTHEPLPSIPPMLYDRLPADDLRKSLSELIQAHENCLY